MAVYLFGSQARGEARPNSDIDLAVLLPKGKELPAIERLDIIDHLQEVAGRTDAEDIIVRDYLDLQPMYERNFREILEAVQEETRSLKVMEVD